jgi:hypothetical protein
MDPEQRKQIAELLRKAGASVAQAIPCMLNDQRLVWAAPDPVNPKVAIVAAKTKTLKVPLRALSINGRPLKTENFPEAPLTEEAGLEAQLENCGNATVAHNGRPVLSWLRQSLAKQQGLLLPCERAKETEQSANFLKRLRQMIQPDLPRKPAETT